MLAHHICQKLNFTIQLITKPKKHFWTNFSCGVEAVYKQIENNEYTCHKSLIHPPRPLFQRKQQICLISSKIIIISPFDIIWINQYKNWNYQQFNRSFQKSFWNINNKYFWWDFIENVQICQIWKFLKFEYDWFWIINSYYK